MMSDELLRQLVALQVGTNRRLDALLAHITAPKRVVRDENGEVEGVELGQPVKRRRPPKGAVAALRKDPKLASQFDAKYGQGSAAIHLGRG